MYWITGTNATAYTSLTVNGVPQFQAANPAGGVPQGTAFTPQFFNDLQGENINIVLSAEIAPAQNTPTQVLQALKRIFGGNVSGVDESSTLSADQVGFIEMAGSEAFNTTIPTPVGALTPLQMAWNNSSATQTLITPAGVFGGPGGSGTDSLEIAPGAWIFYRSDASNYIVAPPLQAGTFAALNGSASEVFAVAAAAAADQAPQWSQVLGGYGAAFTDVTADRSFGTVFTNSWSRPRVVSVYGASPASGSGQLICAVNGVTILQQSSTEYADTAEAMTIIVPPGATYEFSGENMNMTKWSEF